jgi:hypothetical protein
MELLNSRKSLKIKQTPRRRVAISPPFIEQKRGTRTLPPENTTAKGTRNGDATTRLKSAFPPPNNSTDENKIT